MGVGARHRVPLPPAERTATAPARGQQPAGSALLYGASIGAEIGVYGDPMVLGNDHAVLGGMAKQIRLFPELHQAVVPDDVATAVALAELGWDDVLSPAEVRSTFGWTDEPRAQTSPPD